MTKTKTNKQTTAKNKNKQILHHSSPYSALPLRAPAPCCAGTAQKSLASQSAQNPFLCMVQICHSFSVPLTCLVTVEASLAPLWQAAETPPSHEASNLVFKGTSRH